MKESEMEEIAILMERVIVKGEDPLKVNLDVKALKANHQKVHYCFDNATNAYDYVKIR